MEWLSRVADYQRQSDDVLTEKWNEFIDDNKVEEAFTAAYRTMRKEARGRDHDSVVDELWMRYNGLRASFIRSIQPTPPLIPDLED